MRREPLGRSVLDPDGARELVRYNWVVWDRFARSLRRRGWAEATKERETGHHSLKNTLAHILNVHEAWLVAIDQGRWEVFEEPGRQPDSIQSWAELLRYRGRVEAAVRPWLDSLTAGQMRRRVRAPWMPGRYTVADSIVQASLEQAHHLGEVIAVFWQNDWTPPPMTWIENSRRAPGRSRRP
jgi:uncharacterized damage-inducible protein DinB